MPRIWISRQKCLKLQMGVAGSFFEPHPSNLVRIHFILSCKSAEIFVVIFQLVSNLAKISVSVPSISRGVLVLVSFTKITCYLSEIQVLKTKIPAVLMILDPVKNYVVLKSVLCKALLC